LQAQNLVFRLLIGRLITSGDGCCKVICNNPFSVTALGYGKIFIRMTGNRGKRRAHLLKGAIFTQANQIETTILSLFRDGVNTVVDAEHPDSTTSIPTAWWKIIEQFHPLSILSRIKTPDLLLLINEGV
jgi:hypothetical protein